MTSDNFHHFCVSCTVQGKSFVANNKLQSLPIRALWGMQTIVWLISYWGSQVNFNQAMDSVPYIGLECEEIEVFCWQQNFCPELYLVIHVRVKPVILIHSNELPTGHLDDPAATSRPSPLWPCSHRLLLQRRHLSQWEANRSSKQTYLSYLAPTSAYRDLNDEINNYIRAQADQYLWHHRQGLNCSWQPKISHSRREWM